MKITGSILKEARERKNITLNEVAYATKINLRALQAIESGDLAGLPPKAFVRGFVQVYADYLKLDVSAVMSQFHEEMGSTKPVFADSFEDKEVKPVSNVQSAGQVVLDSRGVEEEMKEGSSSLVKMSLFVTAILVVAVAIVAQKTFKKYENEKINPDKTPAVSELLPGATTPGIPASVTPTLPVDLDKDTLKNDGSKTDAAKSDTAKKDTPKTETAKTDTTKDPSVSASGTSAPVGTTGTAAPPTSLGVSSPAPSGSPITAPGAHSDDWSKTNAVVPEPTPAPHAKKKSAAASDASETATKTSPAKIDSSAVTAAPAETAPVTETVTAATTSTTLASAPQEVILEALDQVDITFRIDGGSSQKLSLIANQIHTFKAKGKVQIEVSDGGAVNIIHNGQDRGVPGTLGQALKLRYP